MCFKMMKYCLRTNKIEEVYQWMVECIQNNKGMAELYVVLEMLLEQIVQLSMCTLFQLSMCILTLEHVYTFMIT